jgi:two-component system response regulator YesN
MHRMLNERPVRQKPVSVKLTKYQKIVRKAQAFMKKTFPVTGEEVAGHVGLSRFYFHRVFKDETGKTVKQYSSERQIEKVERLLLRGWSIRDTAEMTGFSHQSHLTIRFKHMKGQTPGQWIKEQRQKKDKK